jgi:hypothetical protein
VVAAVKALLARLEGQLTRVRDAIRIAEQAVEEACGSG